MTGRQVQQSGLNCVLSYPPTVGQQTHHRRRFFAGEVLSGRGGCDRSRTGPAQGEAEEQEPEQERQRDDGDLTEDERVPAQPERRIERQHDGFAAVTFEPGDLDVAPEHRSPPAASGHPGSS